MIHYFNLAKDDHLQSVQASEPHNWLQLTAPSKAEREKVAEAYGIPQAYLLATTDPLEVPRHVGLNQPDTDQIPFLLLKFPFETISSSGFTQYDVQPFSLIFTPETLITCSPIPLDLQGGFKTLNLESGVMSAPEKISLHLNWYFSELYNDYLSQIQTKTENLEAQLKTATENEQLFQLMDLQKSLVFFEAALQQNLDVFKEASASNYFMTSPASLSALAEIQVEIKQALNSTKILNALLNQLSNIFSAIVGNNLNGIMKTLTVITIVLTIPTIIGGLYGMNVPLPFADEPMAYWWLLAATVIISWLTIWLLKKNKFF